MAASGGDRGDEKTKGAAQEAVASLPEGIDFVFALKDRFGFPSAEEEVLKYWQDTDAFKQQLELTKDCPEFTFYDGPPFATGTPHYGHILAGTIKDVVTRYNTLKGRYVSRRAGWDTHGLPVEFEIDKKYNIKSKDDVMALPGGIAEYNRRCRAIVMRYTAEWESTVGRLGRWIDFRNDYKTMDPTFMESVWWVFSQLYKKGLVYRGFKVMPYSMGCTTPISNFEAGLNYKDDIADPAVVAAFPLTGTRHESATGPMPEFPEGGPAGVEMVAWTTTPWTLPSNLALCVHPTMDYVLVKDIKSGKRRLMLKARMEQLYHGLKKPKTYKGGEFEELAIYKGAELGGLQYEPLFDFFTKDPRVEGQGWRVLVDTYVTDDSGTGIVHQAPAFGEDDYRVCLAHGVIRKDGGVPCPLDDKGSFTAEVPTFEGQPIKEADKEIIKAVKAMGRLALHESIKHRYPYCWRSNTPLIYRTVPSWFVRVEGIKHIEREAEDAHIRPADLDVEDAVRAAHAGASAGAAAGGGGGGSAGQEPASGAGADVVPEDDVGLLANNARTHWVPSHIRDGRFHNWLRDARDWAVSRNRYWGTPLPIWMSEDGKERVCVGSIDELEELSGVRVTDLHRETVDKITIPSKEGKGELRRVEEVFDCWFESGSMPYAQVHHPFEGDEEKAKFLNDRFPADFIAEGLDQTRGWFYTLMVLSTALYHRPAFKNVVVNGLVMAEDGKKMSKSLKNYPDPNLVLNEFGADALRLYLISSPAVRGEVVNFSKVGVHGVIRDVMLPWYNAFRFFALGVAQYEENKEADEASFGPDFELAKSSSNDLDKWMMATMQSLLRFVRTEMEAYKLNTVVPRLLQTVQQLTNWYIKLNRGRLHSKEGAAEARQSLAVMYEVLALLCTLMAPFAPFFSEWSYLRLRALHPLRGQHAEKPTEFGSALSVHHLRLPDFDPSLIDAEIEKRVIVMQRIIEATRTLRERIKTSQRIPVKSVTVVHPDARLLEGVTQLSEYIQQESNCFELLQSQDVTAVCELTLQPDARRLGKRLGKQFGAVRAAIAKANAEEVLAALEAGSPVSMAGVPLAKEDFVFEREFKGDKTKFEAQITPISFEGVGGETTTSERVADLVVYVDKEQSDELWAMGVARDIASKLQQLRKKAKLFPTDNVRTLVRARPSTEAERAVVALREALSHKPADAPVPAPKGKAAGAKAAGKGAAKGGGGKGKKGQAPSDTAAEAGGDTAAGQKKGKKGGQQKQSVDLESIPEDQLTKSQRKRLEKMRRKAGKRDDARAKKAASGAGEDDKTSWSTGRSDEEAAQFVMDSVGTNADLVVKQLRQMAVPLSSATVPAAGGEIARDVVPIEGNIVAEIVLTRETCFAGDKEALVAAAKAAGASSEEAAENAAKTVAALMPTMLKDDLCAMAEPGAEFDLVVDAGDGKKQNEMLTLRLQRGKHAFATDTELVRGSAAARAELEAAGFGKLVKALTEYEG